MRPPREDTLPWYKQFWPWFLISLPLSVVIASMVTMNIAFKTSDGLVSDDYYKEGKAIHLNADSTNKARALGIAGNLSHDADTGSLTLVLDQALVDAPSQLVLEFFHPTRPNHDQLLQLTAVDQLRYVGRAEPLVPANWKLELHPAEKDWRVRGRFLVPGPGEVRLDAKLPQAQ